MTMKNHPDLRTLLSTLADVEPSADGETLRTFASKADPERLRKIADQVRSLLKSDTLSLEDLGTESNRWFGELSEARTWLETVLGAVEAASGGDAVVVKDSNGTPLAEGDSVIVIKDLKVKGGSSDLKRGTSIKSIHLTHDPEAIECRVNGSTLVLKTCFLKKA